MLCMNIMNGKWYSIKILWFPQRTAKNKVTVLVDLFDLFLWNIVQTVFMHLSCDEVTFLQQRKKYLCQEMSEKWTISQPFPKQQILDSSKLKEFADNNYNFHNNGKKSRKHRGKRRNCSLWAISSFPTVFPKDLFCRHVKTRACLGKGQGVIIEEWQPVHWH